MKKILKIVAILICILIILLLVHTIRNYVIITDLQEKVSKYYGCANYHTKQITQQDNGTIITMDYYKKDNKKLVTMERNINGEIKKLFMYDNGETKNLYTETENNMQTLIESIFANIKSTKYNGKECYIIKNFQSYSSSGFEGEEVYIDKDTGLYVKKTGNGNRIEKEYEFNNVDDSIFVEPDISQYEIK